MVGKMSAASRFERPRFERIDLQNGSSRSDTVIKRARHSLSAVTSVRTSHVALASSRGDHFDQTVDR